ncbi:mus-18 [Scenedesmus sp. PABB004]|nr:mus-18 [Scenedesmus sp. PABB004]
MRAAQRTPQQRRGAAGPAALHVARRHPPVRRTAAAAAGQARARRAWWQAPAATGGGGATVQAAAELKAQLAAAVTRLNSAAPGEADDALRRELLELVRELAAANPTPRPAESARINGRWVLLCTLPDAAKADVQRSPLNAALAAAYNFFYEYVPIIAGSAVGRRASRRAVQARGNFQTFDTARGWVGNQARFEALGRAGRVDVDGPAQIAPTPGGERITATFTEASLTWGPLRVPFPIGAIAPSGYIDTLYLDDDLRISKGDKGSIFIARRADKNDDAAESSRSPRAQQPHQPHQAESAPATGPWCMRAVVSGLALATRPFAAARAAAAARRGASVAAGSAVGRPCVAHMQGSSTSRAGAAAPAAAAPRGRQPQPGGAALVPFAARADPAPCALDAPCAEPSPLELAATAGAPAAIGRGAPAAMTMPSPGTPGQPGGGRAAKRRRSQAQALEESQAFWRRLAEEEDEQEEHVQEGAAAPATPAPARRSGKRKAGGGAAGTEQQAAAGAAELPPAQAPPRRTRGSTAAAAAAATAAAAAAAVGGESAPAPPPPPAKPKRARRKSSGGAAPAGGGEGGGAAAPAPRRSKKAVAAEVIEAARGGVFGPLSALAYGHIARFVSAEHAQRWAAALAGEAAGGGAAEAGPAAEAGGATLCRAAALGSHRQQVWLLPLPGTQRCLPNLGYACLNQTLRGYGSFTSRDAVKATRYGPDGLAKMSALMLANARDLVPLLCWNEAHGIRFFRLSSGICPWMSTLQPQELPDWPAIRQALREAGDIARAHGHRLTFHPSEFCKIAGMREDWVAGSVRELEVHSLIFDEMGFLPASPHNKINIHVGGAMGDKAAALGRFSKVVNERLSARCRARLAVENDDRASLFSVADLLAVHAATGIPITFDFHHHKFNSGGLSEDAALRAAAATWPAGVRPVVHWSESPEDPSKKRHAHSEYVDGPMDLHGLEAEVDVMIESKGKEFALLEFRQAMLEGWAQGPRARHSAHGARTAPANHLAAAAEGAEQQEAGGGSGEDDDAAQAVGE